MKLPEDRQKPMPESKVVSKREKKAEKRRFKKKIKNAKKRKLISSVENLGFNYNGRETDLWDATAVFFFNNRFSKLIIYESNNFTDKFYTPELNHKSLSMADEDLTILGRKYVGIVKNSSIEENNLLESKLDILIYPLEYFLE